MEEKAYITTLLGIFEITYNNGCLTSLTLCDALPNNYKKEGDVCDFAKKVADEIDEYAIGKRKIFDIPISFSSTPFKEAVWRELEKIPYGKTVTYGEIANRISKPLSARSVGMACGKNPIAIIVPCHRVVGKSGLTGYAYGLEMKHRLLNIENINSDKKL